MSLTDPDRLTFDDTLFDTMGRVLGAPVITQTVWRFAEPLAPEALRGLHAALARGPLQRRIVRTRVPGARDRWAGQDAVAPLRLDPPVAPRALMDWIASHALAGSTELDAERGPAWSLAYAPVGGGGSALSFVTLHVIADGGLKLLALEAASGGTVTGARRSSQPGVPSVPSGPAVPAVPAGSALAADVADAARQVGAAVRAVPGLARDLLPPRGPGGPGRDRQAPSGPRADDEVPWTPPVTVLDIPIAAWRRIAEADGGTSNALLLAVCAELACALGRTEPGGRITIASPVSTRGADDLRSNASTGVSIPVSLGEDGLASLAEVRANARTAYAALARRDPREDPLATARAILPLLPDRVIRRLAPTWRPPLVLASNLGTLGVTLAAPAGAPALSVLNRSITPPTTRGEARRTGSCLSAWWGAAGPTATLCVAGADPDASPDRASLSDAVVAVLARRGLSAAPW